MNNNRAWKMSGFFTHQNHGGPISVITHRFGMIKRVNKSGKNGKAINDIKKEMLQPNEALHSTILFPYNDKTGSFTFSQFYNNGKRMYSYVIYDYNSTSSNGLVQQNAKILAQKFNIDSIEKAKESLKNDLFKIGFKDTSKPEFEGLLLSEEDLLDFQPQIDTRTQ